MKMTIGANIKRLRTQKSITQEQLSVAMNVTCAAVSKWERGETYPDITLLQPLAYYFGVSLDELMGYDQEKVQSQIESVIALYHQHWHSDFNKAREIIVQAYHDFPNDYWIMHYYMWNLGGDMADNDPAVLLAHKEEFLAICEKILAGCTEETLRLNAWNMRAKILHAQGLTDEALAIYQTKFVNWYATCGQKSEQLFAKDTEQYYEYLQKNMYELAELAADKLGRTVFFAPSLSMEQKTNRALTYGKILLDAFEQTEDDFFLMLAQAFLGRMENDLFFRGGSDEQVTVLMDRHLFAVQKLSQRITKSIALHCAYTDHRSSEKQHDPLAWNLEYRLNAKSGRRATLLQNPAYSAVLEKYR